MRIDASWSETSRNEPIAVPLAPQLGWLIVSSIVLVLFWFCTPGGLWISPDSTQYLATARSVASGHGPMTVWWSGRPEPLAHFPPGYPLVIAFVTGFGLSTTDAAWLVQTLLAPANVLLTAWCATRIAGGTTAQRLRVGMVAAFSSAISTSLLTVDSMAWSEPLFITLLLGAVLCLGDALEQFRSRHAATPSTLVAAAILLGGAAVTRYAGVAFIAGATMMLVAQRPQRLRARVVRSALFASLSVAPLLSWLLYNHARGTTGTNRELAFHPVPPRELAELVKPIGHWFVPPIDWRAFQFIALGLCALPLLTVMVTTLRFGTGRRLHERLAGRTTTSEEWAQPSAALASICSLMPACYVAFLIISKTFVDRAIDLDDRLMSPILPLIIALVTSSVALLLRDPPALSRTNWMLVRSTILLSVTLYVVTQALGSARYWRQLHETGVGVQAEARTAPALIQLARELPRGARIYSNVPYVIFGVTGRIVRGLPPHRSSTSLRPNPRFEHDVMEIAGREAEPTYVLYFGADRENDVVTPRELEQRFPQAHVRVVPGGLVIDVSGVPAAGSTRPSMAPGFERGGAGGLRTQAD